MTNMKQINQQSIMKAVNSQQQNASQPETKQNTDSRAADWVWQEMAGIYGEQWCRESGEFPSLMWIVALNKQSEASIRNAVAETIKQTITWPPNLPKFIELCQGEIDDTASFDRFIERKEPLDYAEFLTRAKVGYECRARLSAEKAKRLWSSTIESIRSRIESGEIKEPDPSAQKIDTPEKMKENLTPEQHNQQLDIAIDKMLEQGIRLIGPFKQRFDERNEK